VPERHAVEAATEAVANVLAGPVRNPRYIVMQVIKALDDSAAADDDSDRQQVEDLAGIWARLCAKRVRRSLAGRNATSMCASGRLSRTATGRSWRLASTLIVTIDRLAHHERRTRADVLALYERRADELRKPW
jgi:hypothetical protein